MYRLIIQGDYFTFQVPKQNIHLKAMSFPGWEGGEGGKGMGEIHKRAVVVSQPFSIYIINSLY